MSDEKNPLTARQREVLGWIEDYIDQHRYPPTLREIGDGVGISSTNGVSDHLDALERKRAITRTPGAARSIVVTSAEQGE